MKLLRINPYMAGMIAAFLAIAMMLVFGRMGILALLPAIFASLPIYVAALGWGTRAGLVATVSMAMLGSATGGIGNGLIIAFLVAAPAALAGHQANLAQPSEKDSDTMVWFPLSRILFWISLLVAAAILAFGLMLDFDPTVLGPKFGEQLMASLSAGPDAPKITQDELNNIVTANIRLLPFALPSIWVAIHMLNFLLGMRIARRFGVLARPREDFAANLNMPLMSLGLLVISLVGMGLLPSPIHFGFEVIAGALVMAFSLVGLANMHKNTRGWAGRKFMLIITYGVIVPMLFPIYLFSISGIVKAAKTSDFKTHQPPNQ